MIPYDTIIKSYCTALRTNDYSAMMSLFAQNATVFSFFAGEKPASEFFQNLFRTSRRIEAVDMFEFDGEGKITVLRIILDTYPLRKLQAGVGV